MLLFGQLLDALGTILIAIMALRVHHHVIKEHKIDASVFKEMKHEQKIGFLGISLLAIGYLIQLLVHLN